jgi:two-component system NarL family sensor kinase
MNAFRAGLFQALAFLYCLLLFSCDNRAENTEAVTGKSCDSTVKQEYQQLVDSISDLAEFAQAARSFYKEIPDSKCKSIIVNRLTNELFDNVYRVPATGAGLLDFYREIVTENDLSNSAKAGVMHLIAAYQLYIARDPKAAQQTLDENASRFGPLNDTLQKVQYSLLAGCMAVTSKFPEAAKYYIKTIELCERLQDSLGIASNYGNFAMVYARMGQYSKSLEMKKKAVSYFVRNKDTMNMMIGYQGISADFVRMGNTDSAMKYYIIISELSRQFKSEHTAFGNNINIAALYQERKQIDSARHYYDKAKELLKNINNHKKEAIFLIASTPAYAYVRDVQKEKEQILDLIKEFNEDRDLKSVQDAYFSLYATASAKGDFKEGITYYKLWDSVKSHLADKENRDFISRLETDYETQKKELKIAGQQKEIQRKNGLLWIMAALIIALLLAAAFVITRIQLNRKKKDAALHQKFTNQLLRNTEEERERIARDLHDGISQELLILKHQVNSNHDQLTDKIDGIIRDIRMISRDLHPVMLDKIGLKASIEHACNQIMESGLLFVTADINYSDCLDKSRELQLFRIIQEGLNNVVKYAEAQAAKVIIRESDNILITEIIDNGKGFDVAEKLDSQNSFGLLSIVERSKTLNGKAEINSGTGGTQIKIEVPKHYV